MSRGMKMALSLIIFLVSAAYITSNIRLPYIGIVAVCTLLGSIFVFIRITNGFYTGYLEELNSDSKISIECISDLFASASHSIKIFSATFCPEIYFEQTVFKELRAAKERGVRIEIILAQSDIEPKNLSVSSNIGTENRNEFCKLIMNGDISLSRLAKNVGKRWPHFIVVDDLHVRIEEKHKIKSGAAAMKVRRRAIAKYLNPDLADKYSRRFKSLQNKALVYSSTC